MAYPKIKHKFYNPELICKQQPDIDFKLLTKTTGREYISAFIDKITSKFDFTGKNVLEIGGSNLPKYLIEQLNVNKWVSLDTPYWLGKSNPHEKDNVPIYSIKETDLNGVWDKSQYFIMNGLTDHINEGWDEKFDLIVSVACFEHVINFDFALKQIYRSLNKGGVMYAHFGPIWSSKQGHHIWHPELKWTFHKSFLPDWGHLYMSYWEIYNTLQKHFGKIPNLMELCNEIKQYGYNLNHLFCEDYGLFLKESPFAKDDYVFHPHRTKMDVPMQKLLSMKYPGYTMFDVNSITIFAQRRL